jgi:hypothetical protein
MSKTFYMELVKCMRDFMEGQRNIKFDKDLLGVNSVGYITLAIKNYEISKGLSRTFFETDN